MRRVWLVIGFVVSLLLGACSLSSGSMPQQTGTDVSLRGDNYKLVKAGVKGESSGFRLLGFMPIVSPTYSKAKSRLYESVGESLEGRSIALANQTYDASFMYFILFSIPKITITADIIEFNDGAVKE